MAPEYFMHGVIHEKTDIFSFGVLLLELITGRRAVDSHRKSLVIWVCESRFELSILTHLLYGLSQSCLIIDNTIQITTCFDPLANPLFRDIYLRLLMIYLFKLLKNAKFDHGFFTGKTIT